jgi:hypothetical protein
MAVKYITVIKNGNFIAVLEQAWQVQHFCAQTKQKFHILTEKKNI